MIREGIIKLDKVLFGGTIVPIYRRFRVRSLLRALEHSFECRSSVLYNKDSTNFLSKLCDLYGSDKGSIKEAGHPYLWPAHTYTDFYRRLFDHCRFRVAKVFECGLGTSNPSFPANMGANARPGASLRVWRDYFPNATIYGADIDRDILFEEERIKTFYVDQTIPASVVELWTNIGQNDFDLMIDDGLHTFDAAVCLFENSVSRLANGGLYVIEDMRPVDLHKLRQYFSDKHYSTDFVVFCPRSLNADNTLVVIRSIS